jgi:hypothetical protein
VLLQLKGTVGGCAGRSSLPGTRKALPLWLFLESTHAMAVMLIIESKQVAGFSGGKVASVENIVPLKP